MRPTRCRVTWRKSPTRSMRTPTSSMPASFLRWITSSSPDDKRSGFSRTGLSRRPDNLVQLRLVVGVNGPQARREFLQPVKERGPYVAVVFAEMDERVAHAIALEFREGLLRGEL